MDNRPIKITVAITGARSGDILIGCKKGTKNAVLQVLSDIPPSGKYLDRHRKTPESWQRLLFKIGGVPFFSKMNVKQRGDWLDEHEVYDDFFDKSHRLQLLQPGTGNAERKLDSIFVAYLPMDKINMLLTKNTRSNDGLWSPSEINNTVIQYTGKSSTLVVMKAFWQTSMDHHIESKYTGIVLDVERGLVLNGASSDEKHEIIIIKSIAAGPGARQKQSIGFLVPRDRTGLIDDPIPQKFKQATIRFTASAHKSLLQKITRFTPKSVRMLGKLYDAQGVLSWCFSTLLRHPGAFIPNIQRFVSGLESAAKRAAVTILEDSSVPVGHYHRLLSLLSGALLAQRVRQWRPSKQIVRDWIDTLIFGYNQPIYNDVDYHAEIKRPRFYIGDKNGDKNQVLLSNMSGVLDELKSFPSDLGLSRGWARDYPNIKTQTMTTRPNVMPLEHCIDHHWLPNIAYYFESKCWERKSHANPYSRLFNRIFGQVTGVNPRFEMDKRNGFRTFTTFKQDPFVHQVRRAQQQCLIALQTKQTTRPNTGFTWIKWKLDPSWISGMVGVINVNVVVDYKNINAIVTLKPDDPFVLVAARQPKSGRKKETYIPLSSKQELAICNEAKRKIINGIQLSSQNMPHTVFNNCKLYLCELNTLIYILKLPNGYIQTWSTCSNLTIKINTHTKIPSSVNPVQVVGTGVIVGYVEKLTQLIQSTPTSILSRLMTYLYTISTVIPMNKLDRTGKGSTNILDIDIFILFNTISRIIPGAIRPIVGTPGVFRVYNKILMLQLQQIIKDKLDTQVVYENKWGDWKSIDTRIKYMHQTETIKEMKKKYNMGLKGQFMWLPVGTGKSLIVLSYIKYLKSINKLPEYIVYTLPPSAIASIITEIQLLGIPTSTLIPLKNIKSHRQVFDKNGITVNQTKLDKYRINIIRHDHLRQCKEKLLAIASKTIFIFDEVHLFLNKSLRTGIGMDLSRVSDQFIAFTGTPLVDNKTEKLIPWLKRIVKFEINKKNFWAAANSMLAMEASTGIKTAHTAVKGKWTTTVRTAYEKLLPPNMGGTNGNPSTRDWINASNCCYTMCDNKIVEIAQRHISKGDGVMIVARNSKHQERLRHLLSRYKIFLITKSDSINLVPGSVGDYNIVITTLRKSEGYSLTKLSVMITGVYPSNEATRTQLRGRINRYGQPAKLLHYYTVHIGLLTNIMKNYDQAKTITAALKSLAT